MFCSCNLTSFCVCSPAGVWTVTTVTRSWAQEATVAPACAPMGRAVDATFPTAVTLWLTSWCVCAALATKVYTCCSSCLSMSLNYPTRPECALSVLAACRRQVRRVRPGLLREPAGARRALHALPVQQQHRHARPGLLRRADGRLPQVPAPHGGLRLSELQARLLWQRRRSELPQ